MSLVLDSSMTIARVYKEECTPSILSLFLAIAKSEAWVPNLWRLEVANILELGVRKGRSSARFRDQALADLSLLPIRLDLETNDRAWGETRRLAEGHRLTVYDATYLELSLRRSLPLATLDRQLQAAAVKEGVALLGL